jgi:hypothetical protein
MDPVERICGFRNRITKPDYDIGTRLDRDRRLRFADSVSPLR